jgi:phage baseplate assembly protein W
LDHLKDDDQYTRIKAVFDPDYCYVKSRRSILDVKNQTGSAVQIQSVLNAMKADKRCILYNWATGTGKTSAIWCEIFGAMANDVEHAYISIIRWGTAQDIYSNIVAATESNHIRDIAEHAFGSCQISVSSPPTMYTKKGEIKPLEQWQDNHKRVLFFTVTIDSKTMHVYIARDTDWIEFYCPDKYYDDDDNVVTAKVTRPPIEVFGGYSHRRIFIVDEAHELRKNDMAEHMLERSIENGIFVYPSSPNTGVAPRTWSRQTNRLLHVIRGDIFPRRIEENQLVRCAYLTATPIAQDWTDFVDLLSSMYIVTQTDAELQSTLQTYQDERADYASSLEKYVQKPIESAVKSKKDLQDRKIVALKEARRIIAELLDQFKIDVSLDLVSTEDMPYTNYSMTNTGIGYKGLLLTQNNPILVKPRNQHVERFHILLNQKPRNPVDDWSGDANEWVGHFKLTVGASTKRARQAVTDSYDKQDDIARNRLSCAVYCFKHQDDWIPFPIFMQSEIFDIEYIMHTETGWRTYINKTGQITSIFSKGNLATEKNLQLSIRSLLGMSSKEPTSMDEYGSMWRELVDKWTDYIQCFSEKLDMIAKAVFENQLSPSMVYFLRNDFGGSDHFAMILDKTYGIKRYRIDQNTTTLINQEAERERCVVMNGKEGGPEFRDAITNETTGIFNDDRNAHGKLIRCIIFVIGSAASITLRNVLVCHYPIDDLYILRYVQSMGRIARRSAAQTGKLFGFSIKEHGLLQESTESDHPDHPSEIFAYANGEPVHDPDVLIPPEKQTTHKIVKIPVCSYVTYKIQCSQPTCDDQLRDYSLGKSVIFSVIQLSLATLSQNCNDNADHFARITGNTKFKEMCSDNQAKRMEALESEMEAEYKNLYRSRLAGDTHIPSIAKWVHAHSQYFQTPRTAQSVLKSINESKEVALPGQWTAKVQIAAILDILVDQGILQRSGQGYIDSKHEENRKEFILSQTELVQSIKQWVADNLDYFSSTNARSGSGTIERLRKSDIPIPQKINGKDIEFVLDDIVELEKDGAGKYRHGQKPKRQKPPVPVDPALKALIKTFVQNNPDYFKKEGRTARSVLQKGITPHLTDAQRAQKDKGKWSSEMTAQILTQLLESSDVNGELQFKLKTTAQALEQAPPP